MKTKVTYNKNLQWEIWTSKTRMKTERQVKNRKVQDQKSYPKNL